MQPADIARVVSVSDPAVSPDGGTVSVTVARIDLAANRGRSAVWLVPTTSGPGRQLTAGPNDSRARWSPDGTQLAFVRHGDDDGQSTDTLLVVRLDGPGEPVAVATSPEAITEVDWAPDGERLAWCTRVRAEGSDAPDRDREPRRIDVLFTTLDNVGWTVDRRSHAFVGRVDGTEPPRQVTAGPYEHDGVRWAPDGRTLVVTAARHPDWDIDEAVDLYLVDPAGDPTADDNGGDGDGPRRLTDGTRAWSQPSWSPDGRRIAGLAIDVSGGYRSTRPLVVDVATGAVVDAAPGVDRNFAPYPSAVPPQWVDDGELLVAREDRGRVGVLRLRADGQGEPEEVAVGDRIVTHCSTRGGTTAIVATTTTSLPELSVLTPGGEAVRTRFGEPFLRACPPRHIERFTVPSPAGDDEIDAWFVHPEGFGDDERPRTWPLLVSIHGGPATQYGERWFDEFQLWASAGFAIVGCNPHGSSGRSEAWGRALRSPRAEVDPGSGWGGVDADDVVAVLDATLDRWPALDPARVGVLGGSYGGYLTSWLLARTDRFAAGCSERSANNLLSEEWSCDVKGAFELELGVSHLDHPEEYLRMSPASYARDITAPVLIIHSEDDLRCNIEQADALFVPLRRLGREVEYWRFPGEGHEMSRSGAPRHRIRRAEIIIDFFRRHLGEPCDRAADTNP